LPKMDEDKKNWFLIYTTTQSFQAAIIQGKLEENNIPVIVLNRQDSSYLVFGEIEIYVPTGLKDIAKHLVDDALMN